VINRKYLVFFGPPCNSPNHIWRPALTDLQLHQTGGKVKCTVQVRKIGTQVEGREGGKSYREGGIGKEKTVSFGNPICMADSQMSLSYSRRCLGLLHV